MSKAWGVVGWVSFFAAVFGAVGGVFVAGTLLFHFWNYHDERRDAELARESERNDPAPALDYGPAGTVYFKVHRDDPKPTGPLTLSAAGADLWMCFDRVTWLRPIPLELKVRFLDKDKKQSDYDDSLTLHQIHIPPQMGSYPKKCREWKLPGGLTPGLHTMVGDAHPRDPAWKSAAVPLPSVAFITAPP